MGLEAAFICVDGCGVAKVVRQQGGQVMSNASFAMEEVESHLQGLIPL